MARRPCPCPLAPVLPALALLALADCDCSSDRSAAPTDADDACAMCTAQATACDWPEQSLLDCRQACQARLPHASSCQAAFTALRSCFQDPTSWDCDTGPSECADLLATYSGCRVGLWTQASAAPAPAWSLVRAPDEPLALLAAGRDAGTGAPAIITSDDAGASWKPAGALPCPDPTACAAEISALPLAAAAGGVRFASARGLVYRSGDGGASWSPRGTGRVHPYREVIQLEAASPSGEDLYALVDGAGFWRSADAGATWTAANTGLPGVEGACSASPCPPDEVSYDTTSLRVDPVDPAVVYLVASAGAYRSGDGGNTWLPLDAGVGAPIAFLTVTSSAIYAATADSRLFASQDDGWTWTEIPAPRDAFVELRDLVSSSGDPTQLFALGASSGMDLYASSGSTWSRVVRVPDEAVGTGFHGPMRLVIAGDPDPIWIAATPVGIWRYADGLDVR